MAWYLLPFQDQLQNSNDVNASGYVIKCYQTGTTTPIQMTIDSAGSTLVNTATANADGFWEVSGNEVKLYIDQDCKVAIYENATDAGNDTNAYWGPVDAVSVVPDSGDITNNSNIAGDTITEALNKLGILYNDFETDTDGTQTLARTDFGVATKYTNASSITLTIPQDTILEGDGPSIIYYPSGSPNDGNTLTIAGAGSVTIGINNSPYNPGSIICIYRVTDNEFIVGGF